MIGSTQFLLICMAIIPCIATHAFPKPRGVALPITKDGATKQYITVLHQSSALVPLKATFNLCGSNFWVHCEAQYSSSMYKHIPCGSRACKIAGSKFCFAKCDSRPNCTDNTCGTIINNPFTHDVELGPLGQDIVSLHASNGQTLSVANVSFGCARTSLMNNLAIGVRALAGFGWATGSLSNQISSALKFGKKLSVCLNAVGVNGVLLLGEGPFVFSSNIIASDYLSYTPLIKNPVSTSDGYFQREASTGYFIQITSIQINGSPIQFNSSLLTIDEKGKGGAMISTIVPYTVMHSTIYSSLVNAFAGALSRVPRVKNVGPFDLCFNASYIGPTRLGPGVPEIGFVLHDKDTVWRFFGANSMVRAGSDALCLGFVDGGMSPRTSIVIGGYQLENTLVQFDTGELRFGFSSYLFKLRTNCSSYKYSAVVA